ncbi:MAG: alginate export family protein [Planctomycetota bacterium]|nr:alginate export family protein [Planctomycetota bacterium]
MIARLAVFLAFMCFATIGHSQQTKAGDFPVGTRVEIDGRWDGQYLEAVKLVQEEKDDFLEIKGFIDSIQIEAGTFIVGPYTILIDEKSDFDDSEDDSKSHKLEDLQPGWRVEVEGEFSAPLTFKAIEIEVHTSPEAKKIGLLELEGYVEGEERGEDGVAVLVIHGIRCRVGPATVIPGGIFKKSAQRRIQWDDERPTGSMEWLDGRLTLGGRIKYSMETRTDHDLDELVAGDRTDHKWSASIEATWNQDRQRFLFAKGRWKSTDRIEEDAFDVAPDQEFAVEEAYFFQQDIFQGNPISVQLGRMDFDEGREWFYDTSLDGIRFEWEEGPYSIEASWSTLLGSPPPEVVDRQNRMLIGTWRPESRTHASIYIIDIVQDRQGINDSDPLSPLNESPFFIGIQSHGREMGGDLRWWIDGAYVNGVSGYDKISAFGIDASIARQFDALPMKPYLYGGWAWGSGDDDATDGTDQNFRQTGYQDNNLRYFGVASYRYLGVLMRPELSNLSVLTFGAGLLPDSNSSIDLIFHSYNQVEASTEIRNSRLRAVPDGLHRQLGSELDLVLGLAELWDDYDLDFEIGYFIPGSAFANSADHAWFTSLQLEYNF